MLARVFYLPLRLFALAVRIGARGNGQNFRGQCDIIERFDENVGFGINGFQAPGDCVWISGDEKNGYGRGPFAGIAGDGKAIGVRHANVRYEDVGNCILTHVLDGFSTIMSDGNLVAIFAQHLREDSRGANIVVHDQYAFLRTFAPRHALGTSNSRAKV